MSKKMKYIYAAIGATVMFGTPALAASHYGEWTPSARIVGSQGSTSYLVRHNIPVQDHTLPGIKPSAARSQGMQAYAYAPATMGTQDPTMYAVQHDIPVQDHKSPK